MNTRPWSTLCTGTGRSHWSHGSWYHGAYPAGTARGYNEPNTLCTGVAPIAPNSHDRVPDDVLGESTNLRLVRLRLFLALVIMFAIPVIIATPVIYGLAVGFKTSLVVPTLGLLVAAGLLASLTVWLSRRVLEPAERLEGARRIL